MKVKTRKAASKRVKRQKKKMMMQKSCQNHLLTNKSKKQKRIKYVEAPKSRNKQLKRLLPNG